MTAFVLVHGSWHGGWCWQRVVPLLARDGARVHTPSLTGHAERHHLISPQVNLSTHVADIANLIEWEDLTDIVLCGHSYGGMVVSGVADRLPGRIRTLVYLDAHVPDDGQSAADIIGPEVHGRLRRRAEDEGFGWLLPPTKADFFGTRDQADQDWINRRCTPMPLACYEERLARNGAADAIPHKAYIRLSEHRRPYFIDAADRHRDRPGWTVIDLPAAHNVMITHPAMLADALLGLAQP